MKSQGPSGPDALKRVMDHLTAAGWIDGIAERDVSRLTPGQMYVHFTKKGLAHT